MSTPTIRLWAVGWLVAALLLALPGCKPDKEPEPNPGPCELDPCSCKKPVSADFHIYSPFNSNDIHNWREYFHTDTVLGWTAVFVAQTDSAKYKWLIGNGVYNTKAVTLDFSSVENPNGIPFSATLIIEREPDTICFPNDDGKDTVTKYFYIRIEPRISSLIEKPYDYDFRFAVPFDGEFLGSINNGDPREVSFNLQSDWVPGVGNDGFRYVTELKGIPNVNSFIKLPVGEFSSSYLGIEGWTNPSYVNNTGPARISADIAEIGDFVYFLTSLDDRDSIMIKFGKRPGYQQPFDQIFIFKGKRIK